MRGPSLLPSVFGLRQLKVMHAALGVSAAAVVGAQQPMGAGVLIGCLTGCLYMRWSGFRATGGAATLTGEDARDACLGAVVGGGLKTPGSRRPRRNPS